MAENKQIIAATLTVETGNANTEIKEVNANTNTLKKSLADTGKVAETTGEQIKGSSGSFGNLKEQMKALPGPLGQSADGVGKLSTAFKALLANPIVLVITAIVAALAALYKAFTSTNDGADKMEQIFSGLGAAIDVIRDRVLKAAGAIAKFFSGDFKGALADARSAVSGIGDEIATEFQKAAEATRIIQDLDDELRNLSVTRAKLNADLAEAKEKINDSDLSFTERRKNIALVREAEAKQNEAEIKEAQARYDAIVAKNSLSDKSDEEMQEEADALIKLENLRASSAAQRRSLDKLDKQLNKEAAAQQKEIARQHQEEIAKQKAADEEFAKQQIANRQAVTTAWKQYVDSIGEMNEKKAEEDKLRQQQETEAAEADFQRQQDIETRGVQLAIRNANVKTEIDKREKESKERLVGGIAGSLNTLSEVAGKQTALGKGLAIASTTISTYQAAIGAFKGMVTTIPGPIGIAMGAVAAAGAMVTGLKAVKEIIKVKVPGGGGGGTTPNGLTVPTAPAAPIAPQAATTSLDQTSLNSIGNAAVSSRVYVLDSDVRDSEERNTRLNRAARLGG